MESGPSGSIVCCSWLNLSWSSSPCGRPDSAQSSLQPGIVRIHPDKVYGRHQGSPLLDLQILTQGGSQPLRHLVTATWAEPLRRVAAVSGVFCVPILDNWGETCSCPPTWLSRGRGWEQLVHCHVVGRTEDKGDCPLPCAHPSSPSLPVCHSLEKRSC